MKKSFCALVALLLALAAPAFPTLSGARAEEPAPDYEILRYLDAPNAASDVDVEYPRFLAPGMEAVNEYVAQRVQSFPQAACDLYGDAALTLRFRCAVTLRTDRLISVVFWGDSYVEGGAHPYTELHALNLELATLRELTFADLYAPDAAFESLFFDKASFPTDPVTSYDESSFAEALLLQSPEYQTVSPFADPAYVQCFLKPDGVVLSLPAIHATGSDHFEAQLAYADAQPYCLLADGYWR